MLLERTLASFLFLFFFSFYLFHLFLLFVPSSCVCLFSFPFSFFFECAQNTMDYVPGVIWLHVIRDGIPLLVSAVSLTDWWDTVVPCALFRTCSFSPVEVHFCLQPIL